MHETTTAITTRDGIRLPIRLFQGEAREGSPRRDLLLLHGWPNAGRVWRPLADAFLLSPGYRLIAPDLRGFGDSGKPAYGYTCAGFADDVEDIIAALELSRYAVAGHSMSGKIAQLVAARRPKGLSGLALVAPVPLAAAPVPEEKRAAQRAACGDADRTHELISAMAANPLPEETLTALVEDGLKAAPDAWNGWIDTMREEDFADQAPAITTPVLVVGGGKDPLRSPELLRRDIVERIPRAEYADVPTAGHLIHLEEPEALAALLINFLDDLPEQDA